MGWKQWYAEQFATISPGSRFYFDQIFRHLPDRKGKVLDIGYGNGALLGYFRGRGHEMVGVEINEHLVKRANECGYQAYQGNVWAIPELQPLRFDLMVAFDVAEHMSFQELQNFFSWVKDHLSEDGKLYLRFPEGASPLGLANQNGDFMHVTSLTLPKIEALCIERDMKLVSYTDDLLSSNKLCSFGLIGRVILLFLQGYAYVLKWMLRIILYPIATSLRLSTNSIAIITQQKGNTDRSREGEDRFKYVPSSGTSL